MKKQLLFILMMLLPMVASAQETVEIDGIYYQLIPKGNVAQVTQNPNKYTGSVVIPGSVTYGGTDYNVTGIGYYAFYGCSGLTSITIPNNMTNLGRYAFADCSSLTSINIPNGVTNIEDYAFENCTGLTSLFIPNSVTRIEACAFRNCGGLKFLVLGESIQAIGTGAFVLCPEITDVYCLATAVPFAETAFSSFANNATLHVPAESVDDYKTRYHWNTFKEVVPINGDVPEGMCAKPTISYDNGKLTFNCGTEGATCQYTITDNDIKSGTGNEVQLGVTYNITVFATKSGYLNSEVATATLCWIDQQPTTEGMTDGVANVAARSVLIQSNGNQLDIQGAEDGTPVSIYSIDGTQVGSAVSSNGQATINTPLQPGSLAIIKVGQKSVKVVVK